MTTYRAPIRDMQFVINELAGLESLAALPGYEEVTSDLAAAVLEEAAKIAGEVLAPLNKPGDERGASLTKEGVVAAEGFGAAYRQFVENGWNGLSGDPEYGGQGLPSVISAAATVEMWNSANMSFALCPLLTAGAMEAIKAHASDELKTPLSAEARQRRVVGHDEPDRAAGRFGFVGGPHQGGTRRRSLPHLRPEDLHHLGRSRHDRKCRASGARAPSRRAGRDARHLAVPGAQIPGRRGWLAGGAQRCHVRVDRAQARHPCQPDLRDELWREGRRRSATSWVRRTRVWRTCSR